MSKTDKGFFLFFDWLEELEELPSEDAWTIVLALRDYALFGTDPTHRFAGAQKAFVKNIYNQIKRAELKAEIGRESAQKRWNKGSPANEHLLGANSNLLGANATNTNTNTITNTLKEERDFVSKEETRYADRFARFWSAYPKKVGKGDAEKKKTA